MHIHASCVCGFILAETTAHLPYTRLGKNKLKMKSVIQNCPESHFMMMRLKCCVANSLHASNGGKKWVNSISFNRKLWLMMLSVSRLANQVYDAPDWKPMRLGMIVIPYLSQYCVKAPYYQQLCWIVTMGLKISELWPFTPAPPEAVFSKSVSALACFSFYFFLRMNITNILITE